MQALCLPADRNGMTGVSKPTLVSDFDLFASNARQWIRCQAFRLCNDWHEAEDLAQITLTKIFRHWNNLRDRDQLTGYTHQTLVHTFISERRRLFRRNEILLAEVPERGNLDPSSVEDHATLMSAVNQLGERQRAVVLLRFWSDFSVEQTSIIMRCSPGTVTSQTNRALNRLRVLLLDEGLHY
jgi:RNA polymerase sigma factor (sigma-70 family)